MFYYRYQYLSIACPIFGTASVQYLSTTCPEIEHLDPAPLEWVVRWCIEDIFPMAEFLDTAVVSGLRANLGKIHYFFPVYMEFLPEKTVVPQLKQGHIQTDMGGIQTTVL